MHEVGNLFAEDAVVVAPGLQGRAQGREAIVRGFEDYVHHARTHDFEESIRSWAIAAVTYRFSIRYSLNSEDGEREEMGQEVLVLRRGPSGWKVIWRTQVGD